MRNTGGAEHDRSPRIDGVVVRGVSVSVHKGIDFRALAE